MRLGPPRDHRRVGVPRCPKPSRKSVKNRGTPLLTVFDTFWRKREPSGEPMQVTTCPTGSPRAAPTPYRGIIWLTRATADGNKLGKAWELLLGHTLHRFYQKVSKTVKRGVPLFLTHFREGCAYMGTPTLVWPLRPRWAPRGAIWALRDVFSRWGYPFGGTFEK